MSWYLAVLKKYVDFSGRARRKEFWMFVLFNVIISLVLSLIDQNILQSGGILGGIYSLAVLLPALAVEIRRLHDIGKRGWWLLIALIPVIGGIWLLILLAGDGKPGANEWGPNPKEIAA